MFTLPDHFDTLLSNLEPASKRLGIAKQFAIQIRDQLQKTELLLTQEPHTRLIGSYARNTAIRRLRM